MAVNAQQAPFTAADPATGISPPLPAPDEGAHLRLVPQLQVILRGLQGSTGGRILAGLAVAIFAVVVATAYGQILLNRWNKPFFDALSRRDLHTFLTQLVAFFLIAGFLLILNVGQRWLVEMLKLKLREALVTDLLQAWMQPGRAFVLSGAGPIGVNPDQRMHEDARKLCELTADLGTGLLQASILFVTFAGLLWVLSQDFSLRLGDHDYRLPGFMLWTAIAYAGSGSLVSYWVGRNLIDRNAERYAREADFRLSLVWINEHLDGISLASGERGERRRVELDLAEVLRATRRLVVGLTNLTWVTAGFGWVTTVAPILVAAPLYFGGRISFGGLMMAAAAFTQAQSSLRWFVDNFSAIADWRATLLRVAGVRLAMTAGSSLPEFDTRIEYAEGPPGRLSLDGLQVLSSGGCEKLEQERVTVQGGERVLILGAPGTGKTLLFRALAGLWPWGSGQITRPRGRARFTTCRAARPICRAGACAKCWPIRTKSGAFADAAYAGRCSAGPGAAGAPARQQPALGPRAGPGGAAVPGFRADDAA